MKEHSFPQVVTVFDSPSGRGAPSYYDDAIKGCLSKILPDQFFQVDPNDTEAIDDLKDQLDRALPIIKTIPSEEGHELSFFLICKFRPNAFKFFFEMFSRWLVPGKRLDVLLLYASDFRLPDFGDTIYTVCELIVSIADPADLPELHSNLPIIEMEVRIGVESAYNARRILEIKGLSADEKTAVIQEYVAQLVRKSPQKFDRGLYTEMQHVLVICPDEFKIARSSKVLSRIIGTHFAFRKELLESIKDIPDKRHLKVRLFRSKLLFDGELKPVLSVLVGLNFLREKEVFEEQHLLTAIQNYIPSVKSVEGSFFINRRGVEQLCTVYLEIEKMDGTEFTPSDIQLLREELIVDLKDRIGHLMHPVFMPRNEEEIMRNVLALSSQIKYIKDLPQVFISFDQQSHEDLTFNIILVRVVIPGSLSIQDLFEKKSTSLEYTPDRTKMLGMLRKKYTKEVTVFRVKMQSKHFMRRDHSIDLTKARQFVVDELAHVCGEFRDYNGGMISKQNELLCLVRELLNSERVKYNELLLENFFYSLHPAIMRTVLEAEALKTLFIMMLSSADKGLFSGDNYSIEIQNEDKFVYVMIITKDESLKNEIFKGLKKMPRESAVLASSFVHVHEIPCLGYIYRSDDLAAQNLFTRTLSLSVKDWEENQSLALESSRN